MRAIREWLRRLQFLLNRRRLEADLQREMEIHRSMMPEPRRFGSTLRLREEARDAWGWTWLDDVVRNVRDGVRYWTRRPACAAIAVATLAIGIGANTAVFSLVNALVFRPLPYAQPGRLVMLAQTNRAGLLTVSPADYQDWREQLRSFDSLAAHADWAPNLTGVPDPQPLDALRASASLFAVLGVPPQHGSAFTTDHERARSRVVVISHSLWQRRYDGDADALGRSIVLDEEPHTIVGIMPPEFAFPLQRDVAVWAPLALDQSRQDRGEHSLGVIGRLARSRTIEQSQAELLQVSADLERRFPRTNTDVRATAIPLHEWYVGERSRQSLWILLAGVNLLLLMACVNVANLLLARSRTREREMAVRSALGASRWTIGSQVFTEALVLALAGGAAGVLLTFWSRDVLLAIVPPFLRLTARTVDIDVRVLGYAAAVSLTSSIVFATAPVLAVSRTATRIVPASGVTRRNRLGTSLLAAEACLAVVILVGAGLIIRSWLHVWGIAPGFDRAGVVTARVNLSPQLYTSPSQIAAFYTRVIDALASTGGIEAAGAVTNLPLEGRRNSSALTVDGRPVRTPGEQPAADRLVVTQGYFAALDIPLLEGRLFSETDTADAPLVMIVNQSLANRLWPGESAIGRRVRRGIAAATGFPWMTVAGVVADVKHLSMEGEASPTFYLPLAQSPAASMAIVVRSEHDPAVIGEQIRQAVGAVDAGQPVAETTTLDALFATSTSSRRLPALWMGTFAALACVLAAIGVYGVVLYAVASRTRELAVRAALGCSPSRLFRRTIWDGVRPVVLGGLAGLAAAGALSHLIAAVLYEVQPLDTVSYVAAFGVATTAAVAASYVPARRLRRLDPLTALRHE